MRAFAVLAVPRRLHPSTLGRIIRLPGVHMALVNNPVPRQLAKDRLDDLARAMGVAIHQAGEERADDTLALRDLRSHTKALAEEQSAHHLFGLYFTVAGADSAQLQTRTRAFLDACTDAQFQITRCDLQHWDGVMTTAPLGHDHLRYLNETDTQTIARLLPTAAPTMPFVRGAPIFWGVRAGIAGGTTGVGLPVVDDRYTQRLSPHKAVFAATRSGKSYHEGLEIYQRFAYGSCDIVIVDPKDQEYRGLVERLGGTYLVLSERSEVRFNPLTLPHGDDMLVQHLLKLDIDVRANRAALVKHLAVTEARLRTTPLTPRAETQLEETILWCYGQHGITSDPRTFHANVPTLREVQEMLRRRGAEPALIDLMDLFTEGTLGRIIGGAGTIPLRIPRSRLRSDVGLLAFDVSTFLHSNDETLRRVLPILVSNYCITAAMNNAGRHPTDLIIDEGWVLLQTESGAAVLETGARVGAAARLGVTLITQQVAECLFLPSGRPNHGGARSCPTVKLCSCLARCVPHADRSAVTTTRCYRRLRHLDYVREKPTF